MNLQISAHPDYESGIKSESIVIYKISIVDSIKPFLHYQKSDTTSLKQLNETLANLKDTPSGYFKVSLALSFYNSKKDLIQCVYIAEDSDLMLKWNDRVKKGQIGSSVGTLRINNEDDGSLMIYLAPEENIKSDIDWESEKYNYDVDMLKDEISALEASLVLTKQTLDDKKKLSTDVIFAQSDISKIEQDLSKIDINPLTKLFDAYSGLSKSTITPELRSKYNAILAIQKNWNTLADKLGLMYIGKK